MTAGKSAARYAQGSLTAEHSHIPVLAGENVRYVVPHRLCPAHLSEGDIRLQMRVRQPIEKPVWVEVRQGDNLLTRKGEPYARPGEMVTISIKQALMDEVSKSKEITVAVVDR